MHCKEVYNACCRGQCFSQCTEPVSDTQSCKQPFSPFLALQQMHPFSSSTQSARGAASPPCTPRKRLWQGMSCLCGGSSGCLCEAA